MKCDSRTVRAAEARHISPYDQWFHGPKKQVGFGKKQKNLQRWSMNSKGKKTNWVFRTLQSNLNVIRIDEESNKKRPILHELNPMSTFSNWGRLWNSSPTIPANLRKLMAPQIKDMVSCYLCFVAQSNTAYGTNFLPVIQSRPRVRSSMLVCLDRLYTPNLRIRIRSETW